MGLVQRKDKEGNVMTRKILVAMILLLLIPLTLPAAGRQYGFGFGLFPGGTVPETEPTESSTSIIFSGLMSFEDKYLIDLGASVVINTEDQTTSPVPAYTGISFGYIFGRSALSPRPFGLIGADVKTENEQFRGGPKACVGLWIPLQSTTVLAVGPELSYIISTHEWNYRAVVRFVFKLGPPAVTDLGAGGETPRGMFQSN